VGRRQAHAAPSHDLIPKGEYEIKIHKPVQNGTQIDEEIKVWLIR